MSTKIQKEHGLSSPVSTRKTRLKQDATPINVEVKRARSSVKKTVLSEIPLKEEPTPIYEQRFLHEEVGYSVKGKRLEILTTAEMKVLDWISENYIVPYDFDQDATFGPLARVTHEQRLMIAYNAGLLKQTDDEKDLGHKKCICCFDDTHSYRYCSARTLKFGRSSQNLAPKNA